MEWIKVTDRVPGTMQFVLAYTSSGPRFCRFQINGGFVDPHTFYSYSGITHWMPMPAPPKE